MLIIFLIGTIVILLVWRTYYARLWWRALSVRVAFAQTHIYELETCELTETIENRKKLPVPLLEIGFRVPRGLVFVNAENTQESDYIYKRDLFAVNGMERIVRHYKVKALHRGRYNASQITCLSPSLLFNFKYRQDVEVQEDCGMMVYAGHEDCRSIMREFEAVLGERESQRRIYEDPFVFSSIREYTVSDPMKTINWKATARTGSLMVNTYASSTSLRIGIFLDVSMDINIPFAYEMREMSIRIAATLCRNMVRQARDVSFTVNSRREGVSNENPPDKAITGVRGPGIKGPGIKDPGINGPNGKSLSFARFPAVSGPERLTELEGFLTSDFEKLGTVPFEDMIRALGMGCNRNLSAHRVCVFVSANDTVSARGEIRRFLGRENSGILVVPSRSVQRKRHEKEGGLMVVPVTSS